MIVFWLATLGALISILVLHAYGNLHQIRNDWSKYRCVPPYIFLAGIVDPDTGISKNFQNCLNLIGKPIVGGMLDAIGSQFSIIGDALGSMVNPLAAMRQMINNMRTFIGSFAASTLGKVSGPTSMFVYYLNKIQDIMRRIAGEGYIAAFFGITMVSFIEGFVSLIVGIIKAFVVAMLIIASMLALFQPQILVAVLAIAASLRAAGV
jgi:hypothetical protein